jgi:hypothetical protein
MTIVEVLAHIQAEDRCTQEIAWSQMTNAVCDREILGKWGAIWDDWADDFECMGRSGTPVPSKAKFWEGVRTLVQFDHGGLIPTDTIDYRQMARADADVKREIDALIYLPVEQGIERENEILKRKAEQLRELRITEKQVAFQSVLLSRESVLKIWPPMAAAVKANEIPPKIATAKVLDITKTATEVYEDARRKGDPAPNMRVAEQLIRKNLKAVGLCAKRIGIREVLGEDQFRGLRRPSGKQATP